MVGIDFSLHENLDSLKMVRPPGFEPGSSAREADVLAKLDYDRNKHENISKKEIANLNFYQLL